MRGVRPRQASMAFAVMMVLGLSYLGFFRSPREVTLEIPANAASGSPSTANSSSAVKVDVIKPNVGGMDRTWIGPGQIHAYESAELFAKISGYLLKLNVDIGDHVQAGQLLAEIDSPELHREVDRGKAAVAKAEAHVGQIKAHVHAALASQYAAETGIARAEAGIKREQAGFELRDKQFKRFRELADAASIDERLVDEKEEQRLAALAAIDAAKATLEESKALVALSVAKVDQARADLVDALADVDVAKANLQKSEVFANYTRIVSPYDGIVTLRGYHRGDFIRAAEQNGVEPLLTVERTDVVRLVVYLPDGDVPFTNPGDDTVTEIEALRGHKFIGKVTRIAFSEDKKSKTMRTEVDLPNEKGLLRNGMYGRTTVILQTGNPHALTVPSTALSGTTKDGKGTLFIVRDGKAHKTSVMISSDNGVMTEITEGLSAEDRVIVGNNNSISDGLAVNVRELPAAEPKKR